MRLPPNFPDTSDGENGNSNAGTRRRRTGNVSCRKVVAGRDGGANDHFQSPRSQALGISVAETETFMQHGIAKPNYYRPLSGGRSRTHFVTKGTNAKRAI